MLYRQEKIKRVDIKASSRDESESNTVLKMNIIVNTSEVKDTKDEEPWVTNILLIKLSGYFKSFECGK